MAEIGVYVILALVVLVNTWQSYSIGRRIRLHQEAIEWFSQHVDVQAEWLPRDAPKELRDLVDGKEAKTPKNKS